MAVNVLVVDDSGVMRSMIVKTLRLSGLQLGEIYQAADGREGLDTLGEHWIDLIIVDINMPVMNGEEMIDRMRENSEYNDTPVVVVSTEGSETRVERLRDKGARFIHKPFTPEMIRDTVKDLLGDGVFDGTEN
jgi:two-component system chemotaxis response regulator CheY